MRVLCTLATSALMLAWQAPVFAQTSCDNSTIDGAYAAHGQGWVGTAAPFSPESVAATRSFDGNGNFSSSGFQTIAGVARQFQATGTYEVAADCSVTMEATATTTPSTGASETLTQFGIVTEDGNKIYVIRTSNGSTTSTEFDRIAPIN
jgi:hypothetical protein